jgi:hypothetical protein
MSNRALIDELRAWKFNPEGGELYNIMARAAAALEAQEWQPIETAPKDRVIDLWSPTTHTYVFRGRWWCGDPGQWEDEDDENAGAVFPTHWNRRPDPPQD